MATPAPRPKLWIKIVAAVVVLAGAAMLVSLSSPRVSADATFRTATVTRGVFRQSIHRPGRLQPVNEEHIVSRLWGQIVELAPDGSAVQKGDVVLRLDATPYEDQKIAHEAYIASLDAQFKRQQIEAEKAINQAKGDVASYDLRLELERMRLLDMKKGAPPADCINAQVNLESSKALLAAGAEDLTALEGLLPSGCTSKDEVQQKQLDQEEQRLKVVDAEIGQAKLGVLDDVKLGEQELKVRDAEKTRNSAAERLALLQQNLSRDNENRRRSLDREQTRLQQLIENIEKTVYRAPAQGTVTHKPGRYYNYQPGRDVHDMSEVMSLPDLAKMKVALTVDEARIASIFTGQSAVITPCGWEGPPLAGKVSFVAAKGRDEFERFADETSSIVGTANRQVFDVAVEIDMTAQPDLRLLPGVGADVEIVLRSQEALQIPRSALFRDAQNQAMVFLARGNAKESRTVKLIAESAFSAAIEGLQERDQVMVLPDDAP